MIDLGIVKPGSTIYIPWGTYDGGTGASLTMTGLAVGDIQIYKDGNVVQRASTSGYTLLDTDGTDFDTITGIHGISIDLSDNTTANFYEAGSRYFVVISSVTIDAQTVSFPLASFIIGYPGAILDTTVASLASQTSFTLEDGSADNDAYNGCVALVHDLASAVQVAIGYVTDYVGSTKTVTLAADPGIFTMAAGDNISLFWPSNVTAIGGTAQTANDVGGDVNTIASDTAVIEGWGLGSVASDTAAIEADTGNIYSDTTHIHSDTLVIEAWGLGSVASDTAAIETTATNIYSDTTHIHSDTLVIEAWGLGSVASDTAAIEGWGLSSVASDTAAIEIDTGNIYSDTTVVESDTTLLESAGVLVSGTADSGTTTTMVDAALTQADTDYWAGALILFTSGTIAGQVRLITGFTPGTDTVTFAPATTQAVSTNTYIILSSGGLDIIYSDTTVVESDTTVIEAWGLGSVASDTAAIETDTANIYSDTTHIHSDTLVIEAWGLGSVASDTAAIEVDTGNIYSDTTHIHSDTLVIEAWGLGSVASDTAAIETDTTNIYSDTAAIHSETTVIQSDVALVQALTQITGSVSDAAPTASDLDGNAALSATDNFYNGMILVFTSGTYAGLARQIKSYNGTSKNIILENALTAAPSNGDTFTIAGIDTRMTASQASDIVAVESELIVVHSETTAIQANAATAASDTTVIEGWGLGNVASDAAAIESELIVVHSETTATQTSAAGAYSDTALIYSDTTVIEGWGLSSVASDATAIESELILTHSETTEIWDRLNTDTISEMAQQQPPTTPTWQEALMYLYMGLVNRVDVTSSLKEYHNRAETVIWKKALSDDTTTYTEDTGATGP